MDEILSHVISLIKSGKRQQAWEILSSYIESNSTSDKAWYLLSLCVDDEIQKKYYLEKAKAINSNVQVEMYFEYENKPNRQNENELGETNGYSKTTKKRILDIFDDEKLMRRIIIGLAIIATITVIVVVFALVNESSTSGLTSEQKSALNNFIFQGKILTNMTNQGVTLTDFKTQVANTVVAYDSLRQYHWADGYNALFGYFLLAVDSWKTCIKAWEYEIKYKNKQLTIDEVNAIKKDLDSVYITAKATGIELKTIEDFPPYLMGVASDSFNAGVQWLKDKNVLK